MNPDPIPQPRSGAVLPSLGEMQRAGSPTEQIALQDSAWDMLESYATPSGAIRTRLSNEWLGTRDWRVQFFFQYHLAWEPTAIHPLIAATRRRGHRTVLGTVVEEGFRPSAVWRVPVDEDGIGRFFEAHYAVFHMLFPRDRSFAVHANDGDFSVFAGPEDFVRDALPPEAIGARGTAEVVRVVETEHGKGCMDGILAHYAPFTLD
jgi:hypothetical protein